VQILLLIVCILGVIVLGWTVFKTKFYRAAIPAEIGITFGLATTGSDTSFWGATLGFDRKACGGAIFELTDATVDAIRERGPDYLKNARQGRGYSDKTDRLFHYYSYQPWQPTPLAREWTSEGMWLGLSCMGLGYNFGRSIVQAAQEPGSFYTTSSSKMLLLVPSLKLAIYTYAN
jgi:hypothetical protein